MRAVLVVSSLDRAPVVPPERTGPLDIVTPQTFVDAVGPFLAEYSYEACRISVTVVQKILDRLDARPVPVATPVPPPAIQTVAPNSAPLPAIGDFDSVAVDCVRHAAALTTSQLDTRTLLIAVARVHVRGRWERIWLRCGRTLEFVAQSGIRDPQERPEPWNGMSLTATCAEALRSAATLAHEYDIPISPGVLVLGLLADPATAAARALGVGDSIDHDDLRDLVREDLLGISA